MSATGYIDHASRNRRLIWWLVALYIMAIEMIAAVVLTVTLLVWDPERIVFLDPAGYLLRYAIPVAVVVGLQFWFLYSRHAKAVMCSLSIYLPTRAEEPRFWRIAEEQTTALGIRIPKFGIIEVEALNALSVGEGPAYGLIAITRGMLDHLDDDELAAVLAHEASHIRNGDTSVLAASHALMRTAAILQVSNPLRFEGWRQVLLVILVPPMLFIMLVGGAMTMTAMRLAWFTRRKLKLSRDHIADGEAIRITHFPEALISALRKIEGRGAFQRSDRLDSLMFEGKKGSHPAIEDRIRAISSLGNGLMDAGRIRRDTRITKRQAPAVNFGRRADVKQWRVSLLTKETNTPEEPSLRIYALFFTDRKRFWQWQNARIDEFEWREESQRNILGLTFAATIVFAFAVVASIIFHLYTARDLTQFAKRYNPNSILELTDVPDGLYRIGSSPPQGKSTPFTNGSLRTSIEDVKLTGSGERFSIEPHAVQSTAPSLMTQILSFGVVIIFFVILNPRLRRFLFDGLHR